VLAQLYKLIDQRDSPDLRDFCALPMRKKRGNFPTPIVASYIITVIIATTVVSPSWSQPFSDQNTYSGSQQSSDVQTSETNSSQYRTPKSSSSQTRPKPINIRPAHLDELLAQLSQSVRQLNYRGLFTYEVGGVLDTYKIIHQVNDGVEYERLERLNGQQREVLRSGHQTDCLSQGNRLLQSFSGQLGNVKLAQRYYDYKYAARKRIAGRDSVLVHIEPTDDFRYDYVFGVDTLSGLPLNLLILDDRQRVLERIQFVDLEVGFPYDDTELLPRSERHLQINRWGGCDQQPQQASNTASWRAGWLPPGFVFSGAHQSIGGDLMLTYTDGLASFSVFVGPNRLMAPIEGRTRIGATLALVTQRVENGAEISVTVVGEIPAAVALKVAGDFNRQNIEEPSSTQ